MTVFDFIREELDEIRELGLFRVFRSIESGKGATVRINGRELINFCSNNYLGLANHPKGQKKAAEMLKKFGTGAGASRLVSGNFKLHEELESKIAKFEKTQASIVFPTGYMANLGTIQALVGEGDAVIVDRLDHASIIDGARLSGAKLLVYSHRDTKQLAKVLERSKAFRRRLIVTDHVFSMDGDIAPIEQLARLAARYHAMLMVDTAHSTGMLEFKLRWPRMAENMIVMGTLSKAIGSLGGFVAGKKGLIDYLRNRARSFIYTTALPPSVAAASIASLDILSKDDKPSKRMWANVKYLKEKLKPLGFNTMGSQSQIVPLFIGDTQLAVRLSAYLFENGIFLSAIRPPTVPKGTSRLRLTVTAMHSKDDIDVLASKLAEAKEKFIG